MVLLKALFKAHIKILGLANLIFYVFGRFVDLSRVGNVFKIPQMGLLKALDFVNLSLQKGFFVH